MTDNKPRRSLLGSFSERDKQFFKPVWRRVAFLGVVVAWSAFEFTFGDSFWGTVTLMAAAYVFWLFFVSFPKEIEKNNKDEAEF